MPKEPKEEKVELKITTKVISYTEYLVEARELLAKGPVNGMDDVWNVANALLYSRNKVIGIINKNGEARYVCEI